MAKTLAEVEDDIQKNLASLLERAPTDELRAIVEELSADLASTEHTWARGKYKQRGQGINRLAQRNAALERQNRILNARLDAILSLAVVPQAAR